MRKKIKNIEKLRDEAIVKVEEAQKKLSSANNNPFELDKDAKANLIFRGFVNGNLSEVQIYGCYMPKEKSEAFVSAFNQLCVLFFNPENESLNGGKWEIDISRIIQNNEELTAENSRLLDDNDTLLYKLQSLAVNIQETEDQKCYYERWYKNTYRMLIASSIIISLLAIAAIIHTSIMRNGGTS